MIQLHEIEDFKETDLDKSDESDKSKECKICHNNYFSNGFKAHSKVCNDCDWGIKSFGNFAIINANDFGYRFFMLDLTVEDVTDFVKNFKPNE